MLSKTIVFSLFCVYISWGAADHQVFPYISGFVFAVANDFKLQLNARNASGVIEAACELLPHIKSPYEELVLRMLLVKALHKRSNDLSIDMTSLIAMHKNKCNELAISLAPFDRDGELAQRIQNFVNRAPSRLTVHYCGTCLQTFRTKRGLSIHTSRLHSDQY